MEHLKEITELRQRIAELQNPLTRGNSGEFDVAQTLQDIGFHVEDTSYGEKKDSGYLDLLVKPDISTTENMRIAIEVKNPDKKVRTKNSGCRKMK